MVTFSLQKQIKDFCQHYEIWDTFMADAGIGIILSDRPPYIILYFSPDGPAAEAAIQGLLHLNDIIDQINNVSVHVLNTSQVTYPSIFSFTMRTSRETESYKINIHILMQACICRFGSCWLENRAQLSCSAAPNHRAVPHPASIWCANFNECAGSVYSSRVCPAASMYASI